MQRLVTGFMLILASIMSLSAHAADTPLHQARELKVITLSTMLADQGYGEWGYSALVEVDGRRILFDTGANPDVVLHNAEVLNIDLSTVEDVVISHFHDDHTGGLMTLRKALMGKNPAALSRVYVGAGIFEQRYAADGAEANDFIALGADYRASGGNFVEISGPTEIAPGVWLTGPVPRGHAETNWNPGLFVKEGASNVPDTLKEDTSLVIATASGTVIVTGCGHAGIMNIADDAQTITGDARLHAVIGGIHLFGKPDSVLIETATRLKGLTYLLAGHCTGIEATFRLRELLNLDRHTAVVEAVGSTFVLGEGIDAGAIAGWTG